MTLRSSDLQSDSDLDSIRNSCDVLQQRKVEARGHFAPRTFCPKDKMPQDKMPQGHFAPGHFAPNRTNFLKVDILPQL